MFKLSSNGLSMHIDPDSAKKANYSADFEYIGALIGKCIVDKIDI